MLNILQYPGQSLFTNSYSAQNPCTDPCENALGSDAWSTGLIAKFSLLLSSCIKLSSSVSTSPPFRKCLVNILNITGIFIQIVSSLNFDLLLKAFSFLLN